MFVSARIHGKIANNITIIPRTALRRNGQVLIVGADNRLRFQDVTVLRILNDQVYISEGLDAGDQLCISVLDNALEGMSVRTQISLVESTVNPS